MPPDPWGNFTAKAGGKILDRSLGLNYYGQLYAANGVYGGNLTYVLSSGFQVTIPNNQFVLPDYTLDSNDQQERQPILGQTFLTQVYLLVDNDASKFTMWQANPTSDQQIGTLGKDVDGPAISSTASASASPSADLSIQSLTAGAIAGIGIGVLFALAFIPLLRFCYLRRWKAYQARPTQTPEVQSMILPQELEAHKYTHEMQAEPIVRKLIRTPRYELPGFQSPK
ncbi:MAG: hypothetical protein M1814_003969 [Vezdaea aestivalis]|nr:MAG: hypothetical protein M1814_003969 [Vezdaea aestivalis]